MDRVSKHDVTADPLPPDLRGWVDRAAQEVIEFMNRPPEPEPPPRSFSLRVAEINPDDLTDLRREMLELMLQGASDNRVAHAAGCSKAYAWMMRKRFTEAGMLDRVD